MFYYVEHAVESLRVCGASPTNDVVPQQGDCLASGFLLSDKDSHVDLFYLQVHLLMLD